MLPALNAGRLTCSLWARCGRAHANQWVAARMRCSRSSRGAAACCTRCPASLAARCREPRRAGAPPLTAVSPSTSRLLVALPRRGKQTHRGRSLPVPFLRPPRTSSSPFLAVSARGRISPMAMSNQQDPVGFLDFVGPDDAYVFRRLGDPADLARAAKPRSTVLCRRPSRARALPPTPVPQQRRSSPTRVAAWMRPCCVPPLLLAPSCRCLLRFPAPPLVFLRRCVMGSSPGTGAEGMAVAQGHPQGAGEPAATDAEEGRQRLVPRRGAAALRRWTRSPCRTWRRGGRGRPAAPERRRGRGRPAAPAGRHTGRPRRRALPPLLDDLLAAE